MVERFPDIELRKECISGSSLFEDLDGNNPVSPGSFIHVREKTSTYEVLEYYIGPV